MNISLSSGHGIPSRARSSVRYLQVIYWRDTCGNCTVSERLGGSCLLYFCIITDTRTGVIISLTLMAGESNDH